MSPAISLPDPPLLIITDRRMAGRPLVDVARAAFDGGCRWLMVREKDLAEAALTDLVGKIVAVAAGYDALVSVNSNACVAAACGARSVHLPRGFDVAEARRVAGDGALIGVSAHAFAEIRDDADYVTLSPIFLTESKPGYGPALGLDGLRDIAARTTVPVVALAGVTAANAAACRQAGAAGVAVMGEVMRASDPQATTEALLAELSH